MLNEREIVLAKHLARELVLLNQTNEKKEFERAMNVVSTVRDVVKSVWDIVKDIISNMEEFIESMKNNNKFKHNWHVPINFKMPKTPFIENYNIKFARNNL